MRFYYKKDDNSYAPRVGFDLLGVKTKWGRYKYLFSFYFYGFQKSKYKHPYRNKVVLLLNILFMDFTFRIGIQHVSWFRIRWVEAYEVYRKLFRHEATGGF